MVFDNIPGIGAVTSKIDVSGIVSTISSFIGVLLLFILMAVIVFVLLKLKKRKALYNKKIFWFEEVHGQTVPIDEDLACEMTIPGTSIQVFYIKKKDFYLPRPVKRMGKDSYWFVIKNNREIVNFTLKDINKEMKEANLDYDHTDMRYALTNLKDLIKRNYRDKSTTWWREYKEVISLVILIFVMSLSFYFLISQITKVVSQVGVLIDHADQLIQTAEATRGSGLK